MIPIPADLTVIPTGSTLPANVLNERRYGHVAIDREQAQTLRQATIERLFAGAFVVRAEYSFATERFELTMAHPMFRKVAEGEITPSYMFDVDTILDGETVTDVEITCREVPV